MVNDSVVVVLDTAACGITDTARQEERFINNEARERVVAVVPGGKRQ